MTIETANRLFELRKKHGLSQEDLAEKLGVSRQAVSKWERSEASPDTDNLIALAKIYDLSLDELIYGGNNSDGENDEPKEESEEQSNEENQPRGKTNKVKISPKGIFVESDDGDKVEISLKGIKITETSESDDDEDDECQEINIDGKFVVEEESKPKFWRNLPYPIICVITYLLFGCFNVCGGWALSWIIFVTIPLYYSLVDAIYKKKFSEFAYPVFTAFAFLFMGLYLENWHPSWIVFLTIPVYYPLANAIDKKIHSHTK
ncbi:MAG: helix-turn-helix transcriptional regulator [Clostridia bacterium]|nr:helix-turn-helix transcriptional regulator [Clostridia bacterium]